MDQDMKEMFGLVIDKIDSMDKRLDSMDKRLDSMDKRFDGIDKRLDIVETTLKETNQRQMVFENKISEQVGALFDGYKQNLEINYELKRKIDKIG